MYKLKECKTSVWDLGNSVLYDLCKKHPLHKNKTEILAKIWLIGKSYSASIDRRKKNKKEAPDEFYDKVSKGFIKFNREKNFDKKPLKTGRYYRKS